MPPIGTGKIPCRHCKVRIARRARLLCNTCYDDPAILILYPPKKQWREEPTEAEVERMVQERIGTMPGQKFKPRPPKFFRT